MTKFLICFLFCTVVYAATPAFFEAKISEFFGSKNIDLFLTAEKVTAYKVKNFEESTETSFDPIEISETQKKELLSYLNEDKFFIWGERCKCELNPDCLFIFEKKGNKAYLYLSTKSHYVIYKEKKELMYIDLTKEGENKLTTYLTKLNQSLRSK